MRRERWLLVALGLLLAVGVAAGAGETVRRSEGLETAPPKPKDGARLFLPFYAIVPAARLGLSGASAEQVAAVGGSWFYTWGPQGQGTQDVEFVPMIWGADNVGAVVAPEARWLLGFNEPDGQSLVTPERAAELWREIERLYPDKRLASPAPSHLDPGWLVRFREAYVGRYGAPPRLDALAFHGYFPTAEELIALGERYIGWAQAWGVPEVWCTEFAFLEGWSGPAWERETREFVAWAEGERMLTRYSPFIAHLEIPHWSWPTDDQRLNPSLFRQDGSLTEIGRVYAGR